MILKLIETCSRILDKLRFKNDFVKKRSFAADILIFDFLAVPTTTFLSKLNWITPNLITVFALLVSLLGVYYYYPGENQNFVIGSIILYFGNVFDGIDGKLARLKNIQSEFGAKLDNHFDKVRKIAALAVLTFAHINNYKLILGLIILHYLLQYFPYKKSLILDEIYDKNGIKSLFEPLDALILLIIISPLFNCFIEGLILTVLLQIAKILINKFYSRA